MNAHDELADLIEDAVDDAIYNAADAPPSLTGIVAHQAAEAVLAAGYRKPKVIQYMVVTQDGGLYDCNFGLNREAAQSVADQATAGAAAVGMDYTYRVAEVTEVQA